MIGAAIVRYGPSATLDRLVETLTKHGIAVAVVDNGGTSSSSTHPGPISGQGNVGFGQAVNLAFRDLRERHPQMRRLIVANPDSLPSAAALDWIVTSRPGHGSIVGFRLVDAFDRPTRDRGLLPSPGRVAFQILRGEQPAIRRWPGQVYPKGAFFLIDRALFERLRGFDERFFLYFEETDLCQRVISAGARIEWAPDGAVVCHGGGEATGRHWAWTGLELGRSGAMYARGTNQRRVMLASVMALQLVVLSARLMVSRRCRLAVRAALSFLGFVLGCLAPGWEPLRLSPLRPVSLAQRRALRIEVFGEAGHRERTRWDASGATLGR